MRAFTRGYLGGYADTLQPSAADDSPFLSDLVVPLTKRQFHRRFYLYRQVDDSGVSGTGVVALGVRFPDGILTLRWLGPQPSTVIWGDFQSMMDVHGRGGHTVAIWLDDDDSPERPA